METATHAKEVVKSGISSGITAFFEYDTPKIVHIKSKTVGIINRIIQLGILGYIIGYAIVYQKGYQEFDEPVSLALTKVKGVTYAGGRPWDVADYVVPPEESDACFVTTNIVMTAQQVQGVCAEDPKVPGVQCTNETNPCQAGMPEPTGNGVQTGECVQYPSSNISTCEIHAWCPVEADDPPNPPLLGDSQNFTVLIKNWIEFPKFSKKRRNIIDDINNKTYLQSCRYNKDDAIDRFCPIFELGMITQEAGVDNYTELAMQGGVIAVTIHWNCNLDFDIKNCVPVYSFSRLDEANALIAAGWNFRYANYYRENGTEYRDLIKAYGIRIVIKVTGTAGKFSFVPLLLNFGAGIGLLALATVLCDIIVLYILKKGIFYKEKKYLMVYDPEGSQSSLPEDEENRLKNRRSPQVGNYQTLEDSD